MSKIIIVGDLHGCFDELCDILQAASYTHGKDRLIFTGDLINRGPNSKKCIDFFISHKAESVMGNHEYWLLKAFDEGLSEHEIYVKMKAEFGADFLALIKVLRSLPVWIELDEHIIVHAGLHPKMAIEKTSTAFLTNVRTVTDEKGNKVPWFELYKGKKTVVFGHWAKLGGILKNNKVIGLDSGCVYGKYLSALILPEKKIVKVPAKKIYYEAS